MFVVVVYVKGIPIHYLVLNVLSFGLRINNTQGVIEVERTSFSFALSLHCCSDVCRTQLKH